MSVDDLEPGSHATQPPARYTEASLVKAMEDLGVGRPSTYASVIATILDRGYVWKKGTALVPSFTAFAVTGLLERYFADLVDYGFTAAMEDDLDAIAAGDEEMLPWLTRFYFGTEGGDGAGGRAEGTAGNGHDGGNGASGTRRDGAGVDRALGLKHEVSTYLGEIDAREINSIPIGTASDGTDIVARVGRYGPYLQRGEDRVSIPEDLAPDELTVERAETLLDAPSSDRVLGTDPDTGLAVQVKAGRFGPYVQLGELTDEGPKPRTSSLFATMSPETLTFEQGLQLLAIPRVVGADPESGEEIVAHNGRFGPYLKRGRDTRSLLTEDQILGVTLEEALALFAQPKTRTRNARGPLRELGNDPDTGLPMVVKDGRFGPYVTDGTTNASLRRGDDVDQLTVERAAELLAERRAAGPSARKRTAKKATAKNGAAKKSAPKKTTAKKTTAKKATAKKTTAKKATAKKSAPRKTTAKKAAADHGRGAGRRVRHRRVTAGPGGPRGRLVAFEGVDGCGKSTQAALLAERIGAVLTFEPGATPLGASLRRVLLEVDRGPIEPRAEALLMAADRAQHVAEVIEPALAAGSWVVTDRFSGSTFAYQGYGRGLPLDELERIVEFATHGLVPDLTVLLQVPRDVAEERRAGSDPDRFEGEDDGFLERVAVGFSRLARAHPDRWAVVDGTGSADEVAAAVWAAVEPMVERSSR